MSVLLDIFNVDMISLHVGTQHFDRSDVHLPCHPRSSAMPSSTVKCTGKPGSRDRDVCAVGARHTETAFLAVTRRQTKGADTHGIPYSALQVLDMSLLHMCWRVNVCVSMCSCENVQVCFCVHV